MNLVFESAIFELNTQFMMVIAFIVVGITAYVTKQFKAIENSRKALFGLFILFVLYELYAHVMKAQESEKMQERIASKQYQTVEGTLNELNIIKDVGYFKVETVPFQVQYTGKELPEKSFFFALSQHEKAPILQNAQRVKVDYVVEDGKSRIVRFWVEKN